MDKITARVLALAKSYGADVAGVSTATILDGGPLRPTCLVFCQGQNRPLPLP